MHTKNNGVIKMYLHIHIGMQYLCTRMYIFSTEEFEEIFWGEGGDAVYAYQWVYNVSDLN